MPGLVTCGTWRTKAPAGTPLAKRRLTDQMVLALPFNEGAGNRVRDYARRSYHGTLANGPTWRGGPDGAYLLFDGTDDIITGTSPFSGPTQMTWALRLYVNSTGGNSAGMWLGGNTAFNSSFFIGKDGAGLGQVWTGAGKVGFSITQDVWHTLVVTYNAGSIAIYQDGNPTPTTGSGGTVLSHTGYEIGRNLTTGLPAACRIAWVAGWVRLLQVPETVVLHRKPYRLWGTPGRRPGFHTAAVGGAANPWFFRHIIMRRGLS